jgi:hypothetical protein
MRSGLAGVEESERRDECRDDCLERAVGKEDEAGCAEGWVLEDATCKSCISRAATVLCKKRKKT